MLSKKLTFSLTSFVVLLAFGLAFAVPSAMGAEWWQYQPEVEISVTDVSSAPGKQVEAYPERTATLGLGDGTGFEFYLKVKRGQAIVDTSIATAADPNSTDDTDSLGTDKLHISDLRFTLYDADGIQISTFDNAGASELARTGLFDGTGSSIQLVHTNDGRNFRVVLAAAAYTTATQKAAAILVHLPAGQFRNTDPVAVTAANADVQARRPGTNKVAPSEHRVSIVLVPKEPDGTDDDGGDPEVVSIVPIVATAPLATSRFQEAQVDGRFQVRITLTEEGKDFAKDGTSEFIDVQKGTLVSVVPGLPFAMVGTHPAVTDPSPDEGGYQTSGSDDLIPRPSGRDRLYHPYLVTIDPDLVSGDDNNTRYVEIRVKAFDDLVIPANGWVPPTNYALATGRSLLRLKVNPGAIKADIFKAAADAKTGNEVFLPDKVIVEPGEYLVVARGANAAESGIVESKPKDADKKTAAQQMYTTSYGVDFPYPGDNLETFFRNGGQIALLHADNAANTATNADNKYAAESKSFSAGDLVISEIMWGVDQHRSDKDDRPQDSQWIELLNTTDATIHIDKNEWTLAFYSSASGVPIDAIDVVGNASPYWQVKGSSGATQGSRVVYITDKGNVYAAGTAVPSDEKVVSTTTENYPGGSLASMYRAIPKDKKSALDGTLESSWTASAPEGTVNLSGLRYGTPGSDNPTYTAPVIPDPVVVPPTPVPAATASDLRITEIMVASNGGILPQWIEIKNVSASEVSLDGWQVSIDNDAGDTDVITTSLSIDLSGVVLAKNQVALVVSKTGRNSGTDQAGVARTAGDANAGMLDADRIVNASVELKPAARNYSILSESAFRISLEPPSPITSGADVVGNLVGGWELPMSDAKGERSSIIRREMGTAAEIMGTDAAGWVLASDTSLLGAYVETYYGDNDDVGTPGYDAIGALPVELSKFTAARDRVTGQVIVTWETQSELNNAGFFIKRNEHRTGQFKVVNPTMIPGAGTTSEKQSYTYTDTTAKPNIVYYYQIEDVSLDGNRQTLTRSHRLKGHIGAAGKLTTMWGELKERE